MININHEDKTVTLELNGDFTGVTEKVNIASKFQKEGYSVKIVTNMDIYDFEYKFGFSVVSASPSSSEITTMILTDEDNEIYRYITRATLDTLLDKSYIIIANELFYSVGGANVEAITR